MRSAIVWLRRRRQRAALHSALLLLALAGADEVLAQTVQEEGIACKDAAGVELSSDACAVQAWQKADRELNQVYRRLRANLPENLAPHYTREGVLNELTTIQKLWVQLRDADCELFHGLIGGGNTEHFNFQYQCYLDRTLKRIAELQALERVLEQ